MINRPHYMAFLNRHRDHQIIKVVSGVRRCGKSTLFQLFREQLAAEGVPAERMLTINFEDLAFETLQEYHALYDYVCKHLTEGERTYVFLDEIQHVPQFEKAVDSLFIKGNVDLYITGSNGFFMSGELATLLSGRYVELRMLPLSFKEFCSGLSMPAQTMPAVLYQRYLQQSSFPYLTQVEADEAGVREYLQGIYNTILVKDTLTRLGSGAPTVIDNIMKYLAANIGSLISPSKIANTLTSIGRKMDNKTVERYLQGLRDSLLIYQCDRYDVRGKSLLKINAKYCLVDTALRQLLVNATGRDTGHILENVVYLELLQRGYRVYVGQLPKGEIDFVAETPQGLAYYQVALSTLDPDVLARELCPLQQTGDQYPKYLLTLDEIEPEANYNGIQKRNVLRWLVDK